LRIPSPPGGWNPGWKVFFPEYYRGFATYRLKIITDASKAKKPGLRIQAARLLRETENPITEIAMNAGFRSLRTFNHSFIKTMGCKPSGYRKAR
jgi:hypothetical protein